MAAAILSRELEKSRRLSVAARLSRSLSVGDLLTANRVALPGANLLSLVAIGCVSLGLWRVGADLGYAAGFVIQDGFLSHWQVWIGAAGGMQYASRRLTRYSRNTPALSGDARLTDPDPVIADISMTEAAIPCRANQ
jgi:hypothetical protein